MKLKSLLTITIICCVSGITFFLIQRGLLIVRFSCDSSLRIDKHQQLGNTFIKKNIRIFYKKNSKWQNEECIVIWDENNPSQNLTHLVKQWLNVLHSEKVLAPYLILESLALSKPGSEAYISFDRSLFENDWSIIRKWSIIESLFKSIHHANIPLHTVTFLVHNKIMHDDHIDFSQPLPIQERL